MPLITYNTGNPTERGVYACRVPHDTIPDMLMDKFFIWIDGKWGYLGSDMNYRGRVLGWCGPLQRKLPVVPEVPQGPPPVSTLVVAPMPVTRLAWSKELPTVEGWYWIHPAFPSGDKHPLLRAVCVYKVGDGLFTELESIHGQSVGIPLESSYPDMEWAGPFPETYLPVTP